MDYNRLFKLLGEIYLRMRLKIEKSQGNSSGNNFYSRRGFTLVEVLIVVIVLIVLVALVAPSYKERRLKIEYKALLPKVRSIAAAERNFFLDMGNYTATSNTSDTNTKLNISVSEGYSKNYTVSTSGGTFTVKVSVGGNGPLSNLTFDNNGNRLNCTPAGLACSALQ